MEFFNILKDVVGGGLPVSEIPGFLAWLMGRSFWFWIVLIVGFVVGVNVCNL
jgi:hypothetical protein